MADLFIVSVANAILRDPVSKAVIGRSTALADSTFTLAMESSEVRGGINNSLRYNYKNTRTLTVTLTDTTFSRAYLPLNTGNEILNSEISIVADECIQLDAAGAGALAHDPTSIVSFSLENQAILNKEASAFDDKAFTLGADYAGQKVYATYEYKDVVDNFAIDTTKPPAIINLTLMAQVRDNNGSLVEWLHIEIPSFQIDGDYELSLTADGVSQQSLNGTALSVFGSKCSDGDIYAYVKFVPADNVAVAVAAIAATPDTIEFTSASSNEQLEVLGIRSGMQANIDITKACTYAVAEGGSESISVDEAGKVSVSAAAQDGDSATINVTYANGAITFTDSVEVSVSIA